MVRRLRGGRAACRLIGHRPKTVAVERYYLTRDRGITGGDYLTREVDRICHVAAVDEEAGRRALQRDSHHVAIGVLVCSDLHLNGTLARKLPRHPDVDLVLAIATRRAHKVDISGDTDAGRRNVEADRGDIELQR